jgi:hypothetical protein
MGTKKEELASTTGCLAKAADDEPIFVLRAQDSLAPDTIRAWVGQALRHAVFHRRSLSTEKYEALMFKLGAAEGFAMRMEAWQREHGCKIPD